MKSQLTIALMLSTIISCKSTNPKLSEQSSSTQSSPQWMKYTPERPKKLQMCAAVRGNGNYIFAHWGAMARLLEHYGPFHAIAGGSSGSATSFLYESVYINPAVWTCGNENKTCSQLESAHRMAFLFKSMREFVYTLGDRVDFGAATIIIPKLISQFQQSQYFSAIADGNVVKAASLAKKILTSPELSGVVDSSITTRLNNAKANLPQLRREIDELNGAIKALNWGVDGTNMFMRRGLIDFNQLARRIGHTGDFYAGRNPKSLDKIKTLLDQCSSASVGLEWSQAAQLPGPTTDKNKPTTCGSYFKATLTEHLNEVFTKNTEPTRLSDAVGKTIPTLISTSIFSSAEALNSMQHFYLLYSNRNPLVGYNPTNFSLDWLEFGYWGAQEDLNLVAQNKHQFKDFKTSRFHPIGPAMWTEPLRVSPQEPGLGSALCNYKEGDATALGKWDSISNLPESIRCHRISLGGWSDMYPTQVLKNLGCENIIYITRQDDEGEFIKGVAKLITKDQQEWDKFQSQHFDLDNPQSSGAVALDNTTASLCTDWNSIEAHQIECLQENAYQSPLLMRTSSFNHILIPDGFTPYPNVSTTNKVRGCVLGAAIDTQKRPNPCR